MAAQGKADIRRSNASKGNKFAKLTPKILDYLLNKLKLRWSPEQIAGRIKKDLKVRISYKTIYQYIWQNKANGGNLFKLLPHKGKKYKVSNAKKVVIPNRIDISKRAKIVDRKQRVGDNTAISFITITPDNGTEFANILSQKN